MNENKRIFMSRLHSNGYNSRFEEEIIISNAFIFQRFIFLLLVFHAEYALITREYIQLTVHFNFAVQQRRKILGNCISNLKFKCNLMT